MATTYEGSKHQKYYNKNKDEILAKKRTKTAADKAQKDAAKIVEENIKQNSILKIKSMGKNIYEHILYREYFTNATEIIDYLNNQVEI